MSKALIPVLLTVLLDLLGFGIVIPLLAFYAQEFQAGPVEIGLLMACYSLAQFLFAPLWGAVSDRVGRRPVMLVSIAATALCLAGFASASTLWMLFLFRTLHGMATANISTAQACVADLTTLENRARGMGMIGAAFGIGFTVGPFVGGELSRYGLAFPIWVAAGLSAFNLVLAWFMLPETRRPDSEQRHRPISPTAFLTVMRHPVVGLCVTLTFVNTVAFALMEAMFNVFAEDAWGLDAQSVGRMFGVSGLVTVLVQGGLIGRLVKRWGEARLLPVGLAILCLGLIALPYAPPAAWMMVAFSVIAIGQSIANPSLQSLISRGTRADEQGFVLGTNQSLSALGRVVGPAMAGPIYQYVSPKAPFLTSATLLAGGVLLAVAAVRQHGKGAAP